jgi:hypothetical protein
MDSAPWTVRQSACRFQHSPSQPRRSRSVVLLHSTSQAKYLMFLRHHRWIRCGIRAEVSPGKLSSDRPVASALVIVVPPPTPPPHRNVVSHQSLRSIPDNSPCTAFRSSRGHEGRISVGSLTTNKRATSAQVRSFARAPAVVGLCTFS